MSDTTALAEYQPPAPAVYSLAPSDMGQALQLAEMMSQGRLVPAHLQGAPADCLMVIEQALRWRMSPFAVAQCTSSVKGKLMFEGKLVAAAVHTSGVLSGRLSYEFGGLGQDRWVRVIGRIRGEDSPKDVVVKLKEVVTENALWKKQPDQQLVYSGNRVWARRHVPEVMLGVYTPEEEFQDARPDSPTAIAAAARPAIEHSPERDDLIAGLESVMADHGIEALGASWAALTKAQRLMVGTDELYRIKTLQRPAEEPVVEPVQDVTDG